MAIEAYQYHNYVYVCVCVEKINVYDSICELNVRCPNLFNCIDLISLLSKIIEAFESMILWNADWLPTVRHKIGFIPLFIVIWFIRLNDRNSGTIPGSFRAVILSIEKVVLQHVICEHKLNFHCPIHNVCKCTNSIIYGCGQAGILHNFIFHFSSESEVFFFLSPFICLIIFILA